MAIGSLVAVLVLVLAAMGALLLQVRCVDAAAAGARLAARDDPEGARRAAAALVPDGAEVVVDVDVETVTVRVRAPPLGSALPALRVGAEAVATREPGGVDVGPREPDGPP